jgi:hypothetical protein
MSKLNYHGDIQFFHGDSLHRDGGPAVTRKDGTKIWYRYGQIHRVGGPAIVWNNESKVESKRNDEYWLFGIKYETLEQYNNTLESLGIN